MNGVEKLKKQLLLWTKHESKLMVGLDGYSGIGKTTIADRLKELLPKIEIIHMDEYACIANTKEFLEPQLTRENKELCLMWKPEEGLKKLRARIKQFRANTKSGILLVEGVFLFHPEVLGDVWDKTHLFRWKHEAGRQAQGRA